jgi:hypothetical protein
VPVELIQIPINGGNREDLDSKLLPDGLFRSVVNGRLRKTGELGVRYGYTALTQNVFGPGTLRSFDVVSHNEALLAFGTENSSANGPEKIYTYSEDTGEWRGEDTGTRPRAFSAISELEQVFRPPFVKTDEDQFYDIAYANNHVALVFEGHATEGNVYVHIFEPDTGAILFSATVASRTHPRVVGVGSVFVFCWQDGSDDIRAATFTVGTDTALSAETVLHNTGTVGNGIDLAAVSGAAEFLLLVVRSDTNVATIRRCTAALAVSATGTLTDTDVSLASCVSVSGGRTTVAYVDTSGNYLAESFTTSTLASAVSPVALFGGSTGTRPPGIVRKNSTQLVITASIPDTIDSQLKSDLRTETTLALVTANTFREVSSLSKPFVSPDGQFVGIVSPVGEGALDGFTGIFDVEYGRGFECAHHRGFGVDALPFWIGSVATDGTRHWAVFPVTDLNCANMPVVVQFKAMSGARRQTAAAGGLLYVAGGFVSCWDGARNVEAGYLDTPVILSATPSNGAGALTPNGLVVYTVAFDWYDTAGNRHLSPVSRDFPCTLGASDDTVTLVISSPKTLRVAAGGDQAAKVIVYRTRIAPDRTKRRSVFVFPVASAFAQSVTAVDLASDAEILTQEVVYTQGARGTLSGVLKHEAPFPAQFLASGRDRISSGGLPNQSEWQRSKRYFPEEPVGWSGTPGHRGIVPGRQTGVFSQDDADFVATRSQVFVVGGVGPDDAGNGEFDAPRAIPGNGVGVYGGSSVLLTAEGTWFQAFPDRLYLLPRGGGAAEWLSQPVRDTLASFPVITGAAVCSVDNTAVWACNDAAGTSRRLVCLDLRSGDWYVDELTELPSGGIQAICEHLGRIHLVIGNIVYRQDVTYPATAFIPVTIITGSIAAAGTEGWFRLRGATTTGKMKGNHNIEVDVSYDDGANFIPSVSAPVAVQTSSFAVGATVSKRWFPRRRKAERAVVRLRLTALSAAASEAETLSNLQLEVIRNKKARRAAKQQ